MIQYLVWILNRIFSSHSNGTLSEWKFGHTNEVNIQGFEKPICCMENSFCESFLAVGFQNGRIKIFNVIEEQNSILEWKIRYFKQGYTLHEELSDILAITSIPSESSGS